MTPDELVPESIVAEKPFINALVYGPPGAGKTSFAATAQKHEAMKNVLFLNFEGGLLSVASVPGLRKINIKSINALEEVFWKLVNKDKGFETIQTVVLDSGSELQTLDLEITARDKYQEMFKEKGVHSKRESVDDLWQEDYGKSTARLRRIFRWFRDAPFHTITTALPRKTFKKGATKDSEPILVSVSPAFTDKLGQSVMGYVDFVWYLYADESGERCLLTQEEGVFKAKTRGAIFAPTIGKLIKNPDLASLYDQLLQSENPLRKP